MSWRAWCCCSRFAWLLSASFLLAACDARLALTDWTPPPVKLLRFVPRTESELAAAFSQASGNACEQIDTDEPLEITSFMPFLSSRAVESGGLPIPTSRRHVLSVGLDMQQRDQNNLPTLSRSLILDYLDEHYVSVQVQVQRDLETRELYLHHRPMALVARYRGPKLTQEFNEIVSAAVRDMRSLGLLTKSRTGLTPASLRTLVIVHKNNLFDDQLGLGSARSHPSYELAFVRARATDDRKESLELHAFATTEQRRQWHYLRPCFPPARPTDCSIRGSIVFTEFKYANLYPSASVTRRTTVKAKTSFTRGDLDRYLTSQGIAGDVFDNVNEVLDAMIDGKITSSLDEKELP
ncbi:MAG TPA: hypothetical protein VHZ24_13970 [Pirellulales bacterium]|jgi:hypothetical protein|nr:hypothetical protein [Pirellulales bacterium]